MPLFRRLPKRGFNNAEFRTRYVTINLGDLNGFADGDVVSPESLQEKGLLGRLFEGVKILGGGDLTKKLTVKAQRFTGSAREKIVAAGGQCEDLPLLSIRNKLKPDVKTAKKTAQS